MSFNDFRKSFQSNVSQLLNNTKDIFVLDIDYTELWNAYLSGFSNDKIRQEHNCNCCRSFLKHYGGLVTLDKNYNIVTMWNFSCHVDFQQSVDNIKQYLSTRKIKQRFYTSGLALGTDKSSWSNGYWQHLFVELSNYNTTSKQDIGTRVNESNTAKNVLTRALNENLSEAIDTVLDLILDNSLYKGEEFKNKIQTFKGYCWQYSLLSENVKDNFAWLHSNNLDVAYIRNSVIGTLLVELSESNDIEKAVRSYESKVAPTNYQRPKALVTESMVNKAKETLMKLGLEESIYRKFASPTDLDVNNMLFVDRSSGLANIFDEVKQDLVVDVNSLKSVTEISLEEFVKNQLFNQRSLSILLENKHESNLFSLINAKYANSPSLFKWHNQFSWSYNNGLADSIKNRVEKAGGSTSGLVRVSLAWETKSDLDLAIHEPKYHVYYGTKVSPYTRATLDVDANASNIVPHPVENIIYPYNSKMSNGSYRIVVTNFCEREITSNFTVEIELNGKIHTYNHDCKIKNKEQVIVGIIKVKDGILDYDGLGLDQSKPLTKEMWNMNTNRFHKVLSAFESPNYWGHDAIGNRHIFFHLQNAQCQGTVNPFFNEQIKSELTQQHKRVFEVLGSKLKVEDNGSQVSGLGFSTTNQGSFICKLDNNKLVKVVVGK